MEDKKVGFRVTCQACGSEVIITNDYKRDYPIEIYTRHDDSWTGCSSIEVNIDCKCGQMIEFRTW